MNALKNIKDLPQDDAIGQIASLVHSMTGVNFGSKQRAMIEARVQKRINELHLADAQDYLAYIKDNYAHETRMLVSILTTHYTYFFREFVHFELLKKQYLKECIKAAKESGKKKLRFLSAGCSKGHEVYSLAMFLANEMPKIDPEFDFSIRGIDIDDNSVAFAKNGVYTQEDLTKCPMNYLSNHFAKGTGDISQYSKARESLKKHVTFSTHSVLELDKMPEKELYDAVFCRNLLIYFNEDQIKKVIPLMLKCMYPHGVLFLGISESINGYELPIKSEGHSVYRHEKYDKKDLPALSLVPHKKEQDNVRVLVVDDSKTVHSILEKILTPEYGFVIAGHAMNGIEAHEFVQKNGEKSFDVMTLDIHMPEQTGFEYLTTHFHGTSHPPVVMISSVARNDASLALGCLTKGASDFIEKPALSNLDESGDEIRAKLRCAVSSRGQASGYHFDREHAKMSKAIMTSPEKKLIVIVGHFSARQSMMKILRELRPAGVKNLPPVLIALESSEMLLPEYAQFFSSLSIQPVRLLVSGKMQSLNVDSVTLADASLVISDLGNQASFDKSACALNVFGYPSNTTMQALLNLKRQGSALFIEDCAEKVPSDQYRRFVGLASGYTPATSFPYLVTNFLLKGAV